LELRQAATADPVVTPMFALVPAGGLDSNQQSDSRGNYMAKRKKKITVAQVGKRAFAYLVKRGLWRAR
jgi:hypothetical protein